MTKLTFQFRPVLTVITAISLGILISLGTWQLHRLEWKQSLIATINEKMATAPIALEEALARMAVGEAMEYQPVKVTGTFAAGEVQKLFGTFDAKPGSFYFAPLQSDAGAIVYINRGFVPQRANHIDIAQLPDGDVSVSGLLRMKEVPAPPASWFQRVGQTADGLWFVRDPEAMAAAAKIDGALSIYIDAFEHGDGWPKGGTTRTDFRNKHREYALTWFGLAGALMAVWLAFSLQPRQ